MFKTREEIPPIFFNVINSPVLILFLSYNFLAFFCVVYVTYHGVIYRSLSTLKKLMHDNRQLFADCEED